MIGIFSGNHVTQIQHFTVCFWSLGLRFQTPDFAMMLVVIDYSRYRSVYGSLRQ
jgi:hypothetical protein